MRRVALYNAAFWRNVEIVKLLLEADAKVNKRNCLLRTPLFAATMKNCLIPGSLEIVKLLVIGGADVNAIDRSGRTCLNIAMDDENEELIQGLLNAGATKQSPPALKNVVSNFREFYREERKVKIQLLQGGLRRKVYEKMLEIGVDIPIEEWISLAVSYDEQFYGAK